MRRKGIMLAVILLAAFGARAQEKTPAPKPPAIPLAVQVVFSEYDGEKKIGSLPYTLPLNAEAELRGGWNQLRMGVRVPLNVAGKEGIPQIQYMDVGTNIDCRARIGEGGQYEIELQVERSSIYSVGGEGKQVEWSPNERLAITSQPIVRQYRSTMTLVMKDGQTIQRSIATDPLSGRVLKVDVTLNVVK